MPKGYKTGGRKPGATNLATREFKAAINAFLEHAAPQMIDWLEDIPDPGRRVELVLKAAEFAYPKMGRIEHVGKDGDALKVDFSVDLSRKDACDT